MEILSTSKSGRRTFLLDGQIVGADAGVPIELLDRERKRKVEMPMRGQSFVHGGVRYQFGCVLAGDAVCVSTDEVGFQRGGVCMSPMVWAELAARA